MKFEVTILGSSSATPVFNRNPSAQLLNCNEKYYLIDCGEGTQQQLTKYNLKAARIDHIFISHLHGDHYFGLIGLLSSLHLNGRIKPMQIFAPAPLLEILEIQFKYSDTNLRYPIEFFPIEADQSRQIFENQDLIVKTVILNHRIPTTGFIFQQKPRQRKLIKEKTEHIPMAYYAALKKGKDVEQANGEILRSEDFTTPAEPPRSYAYCSDTMYDESYFATIKGCDTLYHEATFMHELLDRANETHHTTAKQAGEIASINGINKLLIGHFSSRYKTLQMLLEETQSVFENTELAVEGRTFQL
ncbi:MULTISPECIES: ribonuclease Z [unclassified Pedobacter]|uniref:ribonuclease Z n=1 Tax=Pedobacter TaxID=84567 RepID=UPI002245DAC9|nr:MULTISPECIES: ribonuclease Z [unclassified Pedobacter]MCX2430421.1 ribonuclease Z [Pedobacter sp. GR22-10]MCX2585523.1 ribonuclease Z [Pedobacter sp. MR22-3]